MLSRRFPPRLTARRAPPSRRLASRWPACPCPDRWRVSVWKTVVRHGEKVRVRRTERVRVAVPPHYVNLTTQRVAHWRGMTVSGCLGTASGTALAGQPVEVLTAPDNGEGALHVATSTSATGSGSARLGPSRLVEAVYPGGSLTEPTTSAPVHVIVPAKVRLLSVRPARVAWGGTIRIVGQLVGG